MKASSATLLCAPLFLAHLSQAVSLDCSHIRVDKKSFDLSKLAGPHSVLLQDNDKPPAVYNTTWTVDICAPLKKQKKVPSEDQCPTGTRGKVLRIPSTQNVC